VGAGAGAEETPAAFSSSSGVGAGWAQACPHFAHLTVRPSDPILTGSTT